MKTPALLNIDQNFKTVKGQKKGYMTAILYLSPATLSGYQVCPQSSAGCRAACLNTAGHGMVNKVQAARIRKTKMYFEQRDAFLDKLFVELSEFISKAESNGMIPTVRLNGTSDIAWENVRFKGKRIFGWNDPTIMEAFPSLQFYDYTKQYKRMKRFLQDKTWPKNYHLTFSLAEDNDAGAEAVLLMGGNVAAVFSTPKKDYWIGQAHMKVVDGDENDLRFLDDKNVIVGLTAKGKARKDTSGFVRN